MNKTFSNQIRKAVDECGMSRYRICKEIDLDQATMSRFMSGKGFLSEECLDRLAVLLGLQVIVQTPKGK